MKFMISRKKESSIMPIFFVQLFFGLGLSGMLSALILYLVNTLHISTGKSYMILGYFLSYIFILPLLSSYLLDRWKNPIDSALFGIALFFIGLILAALSVSCHQCLYLGVGFLVVGHAFYYPSMINIVSQHQMKNRINTEGKYAIFHSAAILSQVLAPILIGFLSFKIPSNYIFVAMSAFLFFGFILLLKIKNIFSPPSFSEINKRLRLYVLDALILMSGILFIFISFSFNLISSNIIVYAGMFVFAYILLLILKSNPEVRLKILCFTTLLLAFIIFEIGARQSYGSFTLFINQYFHYQFFGKNIPAIAYQSLEPLSVGLLLYPFIRIAKRYFVFNQMIYSFWCYFIGMSSLTVAFVFLKLSVLFVTTLPAIGLALVLLHSLFLAIAELCIIPVGYTVLAKLFQNKFRSKAIGLWLIAAGMGGYASSSLAKNFVVSGSRHATYLNQYGALYGHLAYLFGAATLVLGCVILVFCKVNKIFINFSLNRGLVKNV